MCDMSVHAHGIAYFSAYFPVGIAPHPHPNLASVQQSYSARNIAHSDTHNVFHTMASDFEAARFELLWDDDRACHLLVDAYSEEKIALPPGQWQLVFDGDSGAAYVQPSEGDSIWAADLVDITVATSGDRILVQLPDGTVHTLAEYRSRHDPITVTLSLPGSPNGIPVHVYRLHQAVSGTWSLWTLQSLYTAFVGAQRCAASQWYQNWWVWWQKILTATSLDASLHLRKASLTGHSAASVDPSNARFLPEATASPYALALLLPRWAGPSKAGSKEKHADQQQAWTSCLQAIVATFATHDEPVEWSLYLDQAVAVRSGLPAVGVDKIRVELVRGCLDILPLYTCEAPVLVEVKQGFRAFRDMERVPLAALLITLDQLGRRSAWLFKQVAFQLAWMIDAGISRPLHAATAEELPDPDALLRPAHARRRRMRAFRSRIHTMQPRSILEVNRKLLMYFFAARSKFVEAKIVSVAFDASRIGNVSRMLGCICRPDGYFAWLPPQASVFGVGTQTFVGRVVLDAWRGRNPCQQVYHTNFFNWF